MTTKSIKSVSLTESEIDMIVRSLSVANSDGKIDIDLASELLEKISSARKIKIVS